MFKPDFFICLVFSPAFSLCCGIGVKRSVVVLFVQYIEDRKELIQQVMTHLVPPCAELKRPVR